MGSLSLVAALLLAALAPAQRVWIVNTSGGAGVDFTNIPPAIAAANAGDTVRVTGGGPYAGFTVSKALVVEAPAGTAVGGFTVSGLPAGATARVSGFVPMILIDAKVTQCAGNVILQQLAGFTLAVASSPAVLCVDSTFAGTFAFMMPAPAVSVTQGGLVLQRCTLNGGIGIPFQPRTVGGVGLYGSAANLVCVDSKITGGPGANGDLSISFPCGTHGGIGINVVAGSSAVVLGASTVSGGSPGTNLNTTCAPALQGNAASGNVALASDATVSGALANGAQRVRSLAWIRSPGKASLGSPVTITLMGAPGTILGLHLDAAFGLTVLPGFDSPYLGTLGALSIALFTLDATGTLPLTFVVPNNPVLSGLMVYFHAIAGEPTTNKISFTNLGDLLLR